MGCVRHGKTAVRAGYSIFYVNDSAIRSPENMVEANAGLQGVVADYRSFKYRFDHACPRFRYLLIRFPSR